MATLTQDLLADSSLAGGRPETVLRADRAFRYERGGIIYATDGRVGTLRQVIVDQRARVVTALVVQVDRPAALVLVPPHAVAKTGGSAVFLAGTQRQFEEWLQHAPRHQPERAARVDVKSLLRSRVSDGGDPRQAVIDAGKDFLETGSAAANGQSR